MPCEACISAAFVPADFPANSKAAVDPPGITQGATLGSLHVEAFNSLSAHSFGEQLCAVPGLASGVSLEHLSQGSDGVPPPPPPPMSCFRHRGGSGWSLLDPCEDCLQIAFDADLG